MGDRGAAVVCQLIVIALVGAACAFSIAALVILPERFLRDSNKIDYVMNSPLGHSDASASFRNIALFYRALDLNRQPVLAALLTVLVFSVAVFCAARWSEISRFGLMGIGVLGICFLCGAVYLSQYSKECIPLALVLALMVLPAHWASEALFLVLTIVYAVLFRPYWVIIAAFYLLWRVLFKRYRHPVLVMAVVVLLYIMLQIAFSAVLGVGLTENRSAVNEGREGEDVGSLITDPLPDDPILMVPNALLSLLSLLVPVPLLLTGSPFHALSAAAITFLWVSALIPFLHHPSSSTPGSANAQPSRETRRWRAASLLLAMVSVQAIFEPDFGSYLKHLTPMMPLFLTLVPLRGQFDLWPESSPAEERGSMS